jgi:acyl-CoA synthetase (AMP-forming)/AMP-acid ligase II
VDGTEFRSELRSLLEQNRDTILLRIVLSPDLANPIELTGADILSRAEALAKRYAAASASEVVLLLLPHSLELFLLHLGLILNERLPAILPWPTTRIDPEKYQRNLLHQLRHLPASQIITLPLLANNLGPGLPYTATACARERREDPNLDRRLGLRAGGHRPQAYESGLEPLPDSTDSQPHAF